ncbi:peptide chain release factor H [Breznakiella homolactica]|uniref:Peptide chain release factor H n=1 Tax=Breznakiella homolactica TaxID=2798577 RepID=A0A7T8B9Z1_9SPIR|nr:peptide chain release factor H [Breznakiella homolactica]QQO10129.1 peptide chain release factor H [Breznakiella homolactica]
MTTLWLHISSGTGPEECAYAAARTVEAILAEAAAKKIPVHILETEASEKKGNCRSALLALEGQGAETFARSWTGTVQWVWKSTYRPDHKRKNWFTGVECIRPHPEETVCSLRDIRFETFRASGPGGQNINKTESAVRAVHIPTGKSAVAREERSQILNRRLALARLFLVFEKDREAGHAKTREELRRSHYRLERGNPVRVFYADTVQYREVSHG